MNEIILTLTNFIVVIAQNNFFQSVFGTLFGVFVGHYLAARSQKIMLAQQLDHQKKSQAALESHIERVSKEMTQILHHELNGINVQALRSRIFT